ncbi:MAG TPA: CoA activase [Lachnoclostridium sp.]|uniref:acyl-CoA dehydratase activase n=1 Tax=Clostridium sp. OM02-18AC TaxID=2292311 RepID=UPI000E535726|nr:acyl-CoA dehydratase activase [Clostridium sp. OM02-18AC]RHV69652.1 CoA activase [Clostridium sp. OM02-18AC]HBM47724.1 CoA activase [Lachnoclostridium sp.]
MTYFTGIDIGSTSAKTIVMDDKQNICLRMLQPTGWSCVDTAGEILRKLEAEGIKRESMKIVATGYGRVSVPFADKCITEITCHGLGACFLYGESSLTVIDIGGQDTKLIQTEDGVVTDFVMNDKCSAGTGRFLEVMANTLSMRPDELCALAEKGSGTSISSMCTVFAESEVISLIGKGEPRENIAYAVVDSIVNKVAAQAGKLSIGTGTVCLTGGLCGIPYLTQALSKTLGAEVRTQEDGRYAGAVGAALKAAAI